MVVQWAERYSTLEGRVNIHEETNQDRQAIQGVASSGYSKKIGKDAVPLDSGS